MDIIRTIKMRINTKHINITTLINCVVELNENIVKLTKEIKKLNNNKKNN